MRFRSLGALGALVLAALTVVALTGATAIAGSGGNGGGGLSKHDRELLAQAKAAGKDTVVLIIASKGGANHDVVKGIEAEGGSILRRDDSLGYLLANVATDKVQAVAALDGIQALDLDEVIPLEDPRPAGQVPPTPQVAPSAATPLSNPYMPIQDTNSDDFRTANPTWDGRGVTIGIVDTGIDLDHPSLNVTSTGEAKIIDWVTGTLPGEGDPTWLDMSAEVSVSGGSFTVGTTTYSGVAADGTYRFGVFNERDPRLGGELGNDVNRDGNPAGSNGTFAVLWRTADNQVFVDANADRSFAGEPGMTDYKVNRDKRYFGVDDAATPIKEAIPFVVQTDGKSKLVNIGIVSGAHGSHVAGIAAGNALFGGAMSGQAPGAKIVSLRACLFVAGCTAAALTDGMIYVAKQSNVDVINMSIGGLPSLNDGNNARAHLYTRLIEQTNVQMFISAGNSGSGMNTVGDPSVADKVMSVGSYISKDSWQKNYGSDSDWVDNLHGFSSRGPREDGGFAPQIVAPGSAISTVPTWQAGQPVGGTYVLPPGYGMFNGTSMASPQAAGSAALLISAAKQTGVQKQPDQLREALKSSARYLDPRIGAYEQGVGIIDVPAAWNLLKTNLKTDAITSSVPVNSALSGFLATPGVGTGIYDQQGVTAGQSYVRTYTFTRTSGGGGAVTYNLSWVGNDGTFTTVPSISLGKTPVSLPVTISPQANGIHSAILRLDDPSRPGIEYETSNVVVVAEQFTAANNFSITKTATIGRNQTHSYFISVPAGTPALKVDFSGPSATPGTGQARFLRFHPFGVGIDSNTSTNCYSPPVVPGGTCPGGGPNSRVASNPQAGVWEITIEGRRTSDVAVIPYTLAVSILGATVSPNPDIIASATLGVPVARSYTLTNQFGAFVGRAVGTALGSAFQASPTIANLAQQTYTVNVPAGSTSLRATIGSPSDPGADLDLFVIRPNGTIAGQSADGDSEESVTVAINATTNPPGAWTVLVDGFAVPAGTTTYKYVDVFANPAFGSVSVTDANALRPAGASWTVPGSVTATAAPASGRVLLGNVEVRTDTNVLVGSGDVIVQSVTP